MMVIRVILSLFLFLFLLLEDGAEGGGGDGGNGGAAHQDDPPQPDHPVERLAWRICKLRVSDTCNGNIGKMDQ